MEREKLPEEHRKIYPTTVEHRDNTNMALQLISVVARLSHANLLSSGSIVYYLGAVWAAVLFIVGLLVNAALYHFYMDAIYFSRAEHISQLIAKVFPNRVIYILFDIVVIVLPFGTLASQILTVSKMVAYTIENNSQIILGKYQFLLIACVSYLLIFPLCSIKSPKAFVKIQPFSAVAALIYTIVLLIYGSRYNICIADGVYFHSNMIAFRDDKTGGYLFLDFLRYMPTVIFAINITVSVPIVHRDLQGSPVLRRDTLRKNMIVGTLIVFAMFCVSGFSSAVFGHETRPSNLDTFGYCKMMLFDVLGLVYSVVLVIAYPLWMQPNRICIMQMCRISYDNYMAFVLLGFAIIGITMLLAMFVTDIYVIFGLFASFCGYFLYFVVPLTCCIKMPKLRQLMVYDYAPVVPDAEPREIPAVATIPEAEMATATPTAAAEEARQTEESHQRQGWTRYLDISRLGRRISRYDRNHAGRIALACAMLFLFAVICGVSFIMNILYFVK